MSSSSLQEKEKMGILYETPTSLIDEKMPPKVALYLQQHDALFNNRSALSLYVIALVLAINTHLATQFLLPYKGQNPSIDSFIHVQFYLLPILALGFALVRVVMITAYVKQPLVALYRIQNASLSGRLFFVLSALCVFVGFFVGGIVMSIRIEQKKDEDANWYSLCATVLFLLISIFYRSHATSFVGQARKMPTPKDTPEQYKDD